MRRSTTRVFQFSCLLFSIGGNDGLLGLLNNRTCPPNHIRRPRKPVYRPKVRHIHNKLREPLGDALVAVLVLGGGGGGWVGWVLRGEGGRSAGFFHVSPRAPN